MALKYLLIPTIAYFNTASVLGHSLILSIYPLSSSAFSCACTVDVDLTPVITHRFLTLGENPCSF